MRQRIAAVALLSLLLLPRHRVSADAIHDGLQLTADDLAHKPTLCLVPEMELVPEVDGWEACGPDAFPDSAPAFKTQWAALTPWVASHLTPAVVRAISRWAGPQMRNYAAVPPLAKLTFTPVAALRARGAITYEATVDTLPAHNPLVTRRLVVYVVYSAEAKSILRVTATVRGQVAE